MGCTEPWVLNFRCSAPFKRVELRAFLCLSIRNIGPTTAHVDNKGIIDAFGEEI